MLPPPISLHTRSVPASRRRPGRRRLFQPGSGTGTVIAAIAGAALRAVVAPVAGTGAILSPASTRPVAVIRVRADPGASRHARGGRAADEPINAGIERAGSTAAADVGAVVSGLASCRDPGHDQGTGSGCQAAQRAAPGLPCRQRTGHRVEPLSIQGCISCLVSAGRMPRG